MPNPFNRRQTLENRAFVRALSVSGNLRLAAREAGVAYGTIQSRRRAHPRFDRECEAAILFARAAIAEAKAGRRPMPAPPDPASAAPHRTRGGEMAVMRVNGGQLQLRRAHPGKMSPATVQAFLAALSATCNVRLSAAAAGASIQSFYRKKRRDPAFAREWRLALEQGYAAIEAALLEAGMADAHVDDAWRHNDPPSVPPMTVPQALQLMYLHQKEARLEAEPPHIKLRRGESMAARSERLAAHYWAKKARERAEVEMREAARRANGDDAWGQGAPVLPDLAQVKGWSEAREGAEAWEPGKGLGWRG